jgi:hypothetical protein
VLGEVVDSYLLFEKDNDMREMRRNQSKDFDILFQNAYKAYIKGNWEKA